MLLHQRRRVAESICENPISDRLHFVCADITRAEPVGDERYILAARIVVQVIAIVDGAEDRDGAGADRGCEVDCGRRCYKTILHESG